MWRRTMLFVYIILVAFRACHIAGTNQKEFNVFTSGEHGMLEGRNCCLICLIDTGNDEIEWIYPDKSTALEENRLTETSNNTHLTACVTDIRSTDEGRYQCQPINITLNTYTFVQIYVFGKDELPRVSLYRSNNKHKLDEYVFIKCNSARPKVYFRFDWVLPKNSTALEEKRLWFSDDLQSIKLTNPTEKDNGNYTCVVINLINNQSSSVEISQNRSTSGKTGVILNDIVVAAGQLTNMSCQPFGIADEFVYWEFRKCGKNRIYDFSDLKNCTQNWTPSYLFYHSSNYNRSGDKDHMNSLFVSNTSKTKIWIRTHEPYQVKCTVLKGNEYAWSTIANVHILGLRVEKQPTQIFVGNLTEIRCSGPVAHFNYSLNVYKNGIAISGKKNGISLTSANTETVIVKTVAFDDIQLKDSGTYICVAETAFKKLAEYSFNVPVFDTPKFVTPNAIPVRGTEELEAELDMPLLLRCSVTGVPVPVFSGWFKNNNEISRSQVFNTKNTSHLTIDRADHTDSGSYECRAENTFGISSHQFSVKIKRSGGNALIIISAISAVMLLLVLLAVLFIFYRREYQKRINLQRAGISYFIDGNENEINHELSIMDQADLLPYDTKFDFPKKDLTLGLPIGDGAFGEVFQAEASRIVANEAISTVAVKRVKHPENSQDIRSLIAELKIMIYFGKHLNVLQLLGVVRENLSNRELLVITEFCSFGNLRDFVRNNRIKFINEMLPITEHYENGFVSDQQSIKCDDLVKSRSFRTTDLVCWSYQVSQGMNFLATKGILHGDLAARNILLTNDNMVRISDFGFSRRLRANEDYTKATDMALPIKWMAIESIEGKIFNSSSDVWSFGVMVWELFSFGENPYKDVQAFELLPKLHAGYRLVRPNTASAEMYSVMMDCWTLDAAERPRFATLATRLATMLPSQLVQNLRDRNAEYITICSKSMSKTNTSMLRDVRHPELEAPDVAAESIPMTSNTHDTNIQMLEL